MAQQTSVFSEIPATPQHHFKLYFYAAIYAFINHFRRLGALEEQELEDLLTQFPFLYGYLAEMMPFMPDDLDWESGIKWWQNEIEIWEHQTQNASAFTRLRVLEGIDFQNLIALLLIGLVETDSRFGALISQMQPLAVRRPCVDLLGQILLSVNEKPMDSAWQFVRPLLRGGIVEVGNPDSPRAEWVLRIPTVLWDALQGNEDDKPAANFVLHRRSDFNNLEDMIIPASLREQIHHVPGLLEAGEVQTLVLRGPSGSDRVQIAGALARKIDRRILELKPVRDDPGEAALWVGAFCTMTGSLPVLHYALGPGETKATPGFSGYQGPIIVLLGTQGGLLQEPAHRALALSVPSPNRFERMAHWQASLGDHCGPDLEAIGKQFHLGGGTIRQAAPLAIAQAGLHGRKEVGKADVQAACRMVNRQALDQLATPLETFGSWHHLVASSRMASDLGDLELRCRNRERLREHLLGTFGARPNIGVRALFTGPSGTGKTLAARILAAELEMDLYRVDLASVVNKYIGETEKNLHQVLSKAEELDVVLLLDEGDALMGNRTEVKSAHDRYANLETNFLLQRLESYEGIVIVTTNAGENIDRAFQRRMDVLVNFVPPEADERYQIWALHLPEKIACRPSFMEEIAARCILTGGQIRNAALHATLLSLDDPYGLGEHHLREGLRREYRKAGALYPLAENGSAANGETIAAFLDALSE